MKKKVSKFKVVPGHRLGKYVLGTPLSNILSLVKKEDTYTEVLYDKSNPLSRDVIIKLFNGIILKFCRRTQRLKTIEIYDTKNIILQYYQKIFSSSSVGGDEKVFGTFVKIYEIFGPTHPGKYDAKSRLYQLSYPGICFMFPVPKKFSKKYEDDPKEIPIQFENNKTPIFNRVFIYYGDKIEDITFDDDESDDEEDSDDEDEGEVDSAMTSIDQSVFHDYNPSQKKKKKKKKDEDEEEGENGGKKEKEIFFRDEDDEEDPYYFQEIDVFLGEKILLTKQKVRINFDDSVQDVLTKLGKPEAIFYKSHSDRLRIHGNQVGTGKKKKTGSKIGSTKLQNSSVDYFYNYFKLGFDIMFDGNSHEVKKFVFHSNIIGSKDFNIYKKANVMIPLREFYKGYNLSSSMQHKMIHQDMSFTEIKTLLRSLKCSKPLVNTTSHSNNPFGSTYFYSFKNCIFEVLTNGYISSICVYKDE